MADGFQVSLPAMAGLAGTFRTGRGEMHDAGEPMVAAAASVSTGDPALDAQTATLINRVAGVFVRVGNALGDIGDAVDTAAGNYRDGDDQVAADYRSLMPGGVDGQDVPQV